MSVSTVARSSKRPSQSRKRCIIPVAGEVILLGLLAEVIPAVVIATALVALSEAGIVVEAGIRGDGDTSPPTTVSNILFTFASDSFVHTFNGPLEESFSMVI